MNHKKEEFEIPLTEDLMREHGVLNRVLLIYEEIVKRINNHHDFPISALQKTIDIIRLFIENHHERLEEDYIFPLFEKHKKELALIAVLKEQHIKGREITAQLEKLVTASHVDHAAKLSIKHLLEEFIIMYRPHESHEDTQIFPLVRSFMSEKEFEELGELFEDFENQLFGEDGFELMIKKLESIEKELDLYDLHQFTPVD
ncbi:MAG: hemerythrin domain-containing protein [Candidatus Dependentiae bacterium]|nr:hemerythrin domain-containing protein [Candidatus Dependentiae bacterium]